MIWAIVRRTQEKNGQILKSALWQKFNIKSMDLNSCNTKKKNTRTLSKAVIAFETSSRT